MAGPLILCAVVLWHDADTGRCDGVKFRLANVDTPELAGSPSCRDRRRAYAWCDYAKGIAARDFVRAYTAGRRVTVRYTGAWSYDRRVAEVFVDGRDLGAVLRARGLGR